MVILVLGLHVLDHSIASVWWWGSDTVEFVFDSWLCSPSRGIGFLCRCLLVGFAANIMCGTQNILNSAPWFSPHFGTVSPSVSCFPGTKKITHNVFET